MLLSPVLVGMGAVVTGILNSYEQFTMPAIAPLLYNLAIIAAAIFLAPVMGVEGLAVGVVIGSAAHLLVQLPSLARIGGEFELRINLGHPGVRKVGWLMGPRLLGLAAGQLNFLVSTVLASGLVAGSLTAYNYAFQLSQIPVGIIGVSIAVALFPTLSHDAALGNVGRIRAQVSGSVRVLVFISAILTAMTIVLREPIAATFYQYGAFSAEDSARTASALAFFAIGLGRPYRGARADARLLRDAGHAHTGGVGDRGRGDQHSAHGRRWSGRWGSRASPWPFRCRR